MTLDLSKPVKTRDGQEVRIYVTDSDTILGYPIVGDVKTNGSIWRLTRWTVGGRIGSESVHPGDLVNVQMEHTVWTNIYDSRCYTSKTQADEQAGSTRKACIKITYTEGEGLK